MGFIYTLADPRNGKIRFVGIGDGPAIHEAATFNPYDGSPRSLWMCILKSKRLVPVFTIIKDISTSDENKALAAFVTGMGSAGADLLNETLARPRPKIGYKATERLALAWEMEHQDEE